MNKYYNNHMAKKSRKKGFTIVELSLSIAFIAILSITVVLIITNAISSYHRGLTLNQINATGMDLVDDLRSAVQNSPARSVISKCAELFDDSEEVRKCQEDHAGSLVSAKKLGTVKIGRNSTISSVPIFGVFCTGAYSYIWNSGYFFNSVEYSVTSSSRATLKYKTTNGTEAYTPDFKLIKIEDEDRAACIAASISKSNDSQNKKYVKGVNNSMVSCNQEHGCVIDITGYNALDADEPFIDVLSTSTNNNLAIYDITPSIPAESSTNNSLFYSVSFILGTVQGGINIKSAGNFCATPGGFNSDVENFDYCAINKFNFAAQASGG